MTTNKDADTQREIYRTFHRLARKVEAESPLLTNSGTSISFVSKIFSLEIMQRHTVRITQKLFDSYKKERNEPTVVPEGVNKYYNESIAFFEAYLNSFYSLFQIIAKITPYFYDQEIPSDYFERQSTYFIQNESIDVDYANYLKSHMKWYDDLVCNRHAISHNVAAFLGFGEREVEFIHMPKKRIDYFEDGKPTRKLTEYISSNWVALFHFLDFYTKHYSNSQIFVNKEEETERVKRQTSRTSPTP